MGKLNHPNIVTTFDFGEEGDLAFLAMELLEGTDLRTRLKDKGRATDEAVETALQVADGLGFAHERGVVHRDIKPGNIMLLERGGAKIMDFGIARMRSDDFKTSTVMVLGTPRFMSPEQIAGAAVDQRSDVFSLGVVLYEMLTGQMLFAGADSAQIAHNVTSVEHEPPSRRNKEVTSLLDFVVARALKKDPSVRYQDAYELAADLRTCLAELRGRPVTETKRDTTKTVKLARKIDSKQPAPFAGAIAPSTRLSLSRLFDSRAALKRLASPGMLDRAALARLPRHVGLLRRICRDAGPRLLFLSSLVAAAASGYIAFGQSSNRESRLRGEFTEEDPLPLSRAQELARRPAQDRAARLEDHAAVREVERKLHVLLDEEDGDAMLVADAADHSADFLHHPRREAEKRLVDHQELRPRHQAARDRHHLLLAAGEGVRELRATLPEQGKKAFEACERFVAMRAGTRVVGAEEHVVVHAEKRKQPPALEDMGNADARSPVGRHGLNALAIETNAARHGTQQPRDRVDERGLAGAVRAEEGHDFAAADVEVGLPDHLELAIRDIERLDGKLSFEVHATYAWPR